MKKSLSIIFALALLTSISSCGKDEPIPEVDQEELSAAKLVFTEVEREAHGDHFHYNDIKDAEKDSISFSGINFIAPVGAHLDLEHNKTYRFELKVTDFQGRPSQQTFVERHDQHFAFFNQIPVNSATIVYKDKKTDGTSVKVGTIGYITVDKPTNLFVLRYIMKHLNPGVKASINVNSDIQIVDFNKFSGATDLDLKFEMHFVDADH
ncbi:hypothetical protein ACFRAE_15430 [Sphingobacterium sp. HJSM2_6]|uniref:hypothetical protein n=1 Tax=Sphingobacterium sp. HJSM2_6 TaxID=3366264 RepID=UPI003BCE30BB